MTAAAVTFKLPPWAFPSLFPVGLVVRSCSPPLGAMAIAQVVGTDLTVYDTDPEKVPDRDLRQIFVAAHLPTEMRKASADASLTSIDAWAVLGDTIAEVKAQLALVIGTENLGDTDQKRASSLLFLAAVWKKCSSISTLRDTARVRLEEEPHRIPAMQDGDYETARATFKAAHPNIVLLADREPHRRFLDKLLRDHTLSDTTKCYQLGEVWLRSDLIPTTEGVHKNVQSLLAAASIEGDVNPGHGEEIMRRITALHIGLEMVGRMALDLTTCTTVGGETVFAGGGQSYIKELEERRSDCKWPGFLQIADWMFRKKVNELQVDHKESFSSLPAAYNEVLKNHHYIWTEARQAAMEEAKGEPSTKTITKHNDDDDNDYDDNVTTGKKRKRGGRKQTVKNLKEENKALKNQVSGTGAASSNDPRGSKGGGGKGDGKKQQIPQEEYTALIAALKGKPRHEFCIFDCSSLGCSFGSSCRNAAKHNKCPVCGGSHNWYANHYKKGGFIGGRGGRR